MIPLDEEMRERLLKIEATRGFAPEPEAEHLPEKPQAYAAMACGAPVRYRNCLRETWQGTWPLPEWDGFPWCLVLLGGPGRGKTHAATALFNELARKSGLKAWWLSFPDALETWKAEFSVDPQGGITVRDKLRGDRLLMLDDVGASRDPNGSAAELLRSTLLFRYDRELPTIITTNAESLGPFALIDERLASRLNDGIVKTLSGEDWRGRK